MKDELSHHRALKLAADTQRAREHPRTNAERIRNMCDEELADFLCGIDHYWDGNYIVILDDTHMNDSPIDIMDWLRKEVE